MGRSTPRVNPKCRHTYASASRAYVNRFVKEVVGEGGGCLREGKAVGVEGFLWGEKRQAAQLQGKLH